MKIRLFRYILLCAVCACVSLPLSAQTEEWKEMRRGIQAFQQKKYDEAEVSFLKAIKANRNNGRAYFALGDVYLAKKNPTAATQQFQTAIRLEKNNMVKSMSYYNMGYIGQSAALTAKPEEKQKYLQEAIAHYKDALRLNPHDDNARYNLVLCKKQLKDEKNQHQSQQKNKEEEKQQQQQQQQHDLKQEQLQTEQLINLAKQAEKAAKQKVDAARPKRQSKEMNW